MIFVHFFIIYSTCEATLKYSYINFFHIYIFYHKKRLEKSITLTRSPKVQATQASIKTLYLPRNLIRENQTSRPSSLPREGPCVRTRLPAPD